MNRRTKFAKKYQTGGQVSPKGLNTAGMISSFIPELNQKRDPGAHKSVMTDDKINNTRSQLEGFAMSTGEPIGMTLGLASKVGRQVDKAAKDEFGIYKSKGAMVADRLFDPIGNVQDLATGETFKQIKNVMKGKDPQQHLIDKMNEIKGNRNINKVADQLDSQLSGRYPDPKYIAPAYGRKGLKVKSKYSC